jgi:hypothetical protein
MPWVNGAWRYPTPVPTATPTPGPTPVSCGDYVCNLDCGETEANCPQDCGVCGDNECWPTTENVQNCPQDCHKCGDGICSPGSEDNTTCPQDCSRCGDGICDCVKENTQNCPADCASCGDGICSENENKETCPADCKVCGDGICSPGEDLNSCPGDCHQCGDGVCQADFENYGNCAQDCTVCGDGVCTAGETQQNCAKDCGEPTPTPTPTPTASPTPTPPPLECPPDKPLSCGHGICACGRCSNNPLDPKCLGCFAPETKIKMADGSEKPIARIQAGDLVWNPVTREGVRVKYPTVGPEKIAMWELGYADKAVIVTQDHPVVINNAALESEWNNLSGLMGRTSLGQPPVRGELPRNYKVIRASDLKVGDMVYSQDGKFHKLTVLRTLPIKADQQVMNLMLDTTSSRSEDHMLVADGIITGDLYLQEQLKK